MIRFACPRCKSVLESAEHTGGSKVHCPKCQQRLQVPMPAVNKTILAPLVPNPPAPSNPTFPLPPRAIPLGSPATLLPLEVLPADGPHDGSNRIAVGVCTIVFGAFGVHYFYFGSWLRGTILLLFGLLCLGTCSPLLLLLPFGFAVYDGVRYLTMTDQEFARILATRSPVSRLQTWIMAGVLAVLFLLAVAAVLWTVLVVSRLGYY